MVLLLGSCKIKHIPLLLFLFECEGEDSLQGFVTHLSDMHIPWCSPSWRAAAAWAAAAGGARAREARAARPAAGACRAAPRATPRRLTARECWPPHTRSQRQHWHTARPRDTRPSHPAPCRATYHNTFNPIGDSLRQCGRVNITRYNERHYIVQFIR